MRGIFTLYNKPHNESVKPLVKRRSSTTEALNIQNDLLSFDEIKTLFAPYANYDFVIVGDVFWPTGQNICRWCKENNTKCYFLQHGQWIYVDNKKRLDYYPSHTLLFGDDVKNMCQSWEYAKHSELHVVGSPRYDNIRTSNGDYVFFLPPVIEELSSGKSSINDNNLRLLMHLAGIDKQCKLHIQPHYREGKIDLLHKLFPNAEFHDNKKSTLDLVANSSCIMTSRNSTSVLDVIACGKKVILVDLPQFDRSHFKCGYFGNFVLESRTKKELCKHISRYYETRIVDEEYIKNAKKYIHLNDAGSRVLNLIFGD